MTATPVPRAELPDDRLGPHRAQLRDLRRRHRDVDLVMLPMPPTSEATPIHTYAAADRADLVALTAEAVAVVEQVVGRPVDQQHEHWVHDRLIVGAAHHHVAPGESIALLRRLLVWAGGSDGWVALPVASRRPSVLLWCRDADPRGQVRTRVRAWPRALTTQLVAVRGTSEVVR